MKKKKHLYASLILLIAFILWTVAVKFIDVAPIGQNGTNVGFSSLNGFVHRIIGTHMHLYVITDWLSIIPVSVTAGFALLGILQWVKRKRLFLVDRNLFVLGASYILAFAFYLLFEYVIINYRPVLINGSLEASYPSSTTLLVLSIMPTAAIQLKIRIKNTVFKKTVCVLICVFTLFMVAGRLVSGVHWLTDIIGGILLSTSIVTAYRYFAHG